MTREPTLESQPRSLANAIEFVRSRDDRVPTAGIILGSGLGDVVDQIEDATTIPYCEIPGFESSSVGGHRSELILGRLGEANVVCMAGRYHRYEGWNNDTVTFPVRLIAGLGADRLIVSNASGGLSPKLRVGDILVIRDHIDLIGGRFSWNHGSPIGPPSRRENLYDLEMSKTALRVGIANQFTTMEGTYLATLGPNFETRSEYRMMRLLGADTVGMSTVPEVLAAAHVKMRVLGLSMVANVANPDQSLIANHDEVLESGRRAAAKMELIIREVVRPEA